MRVSLMYALHPTVAQTRTSSEAVFLEQNILSTSPVNTDFNCTSKIFITIIVTS